MVGPALELGHDPDMSIFLYGTLLNRDLLTALLGSGAGDDARSAWLADHAVVRAAQADLPMLVAAPGAVAQGLIVQDLSSAQRARLDAYEGAFGYVLRPVTAHMNGSGAPVAALAYVAPTGQAAGDAGWSLSAWEADHLAPAILAVQEIAAHDPPLTPRALAAQWLMIERRAHARHRARTSAPAPATLRHAAAPGDCAVTHVAPPLGRFFKLAGVDLNHRTFGGTLSDDLEREVFMGIDAALVLPYDATRDRLLLVEQFRMGPLQRHDPNPWCLEPVAGMIDPRETPRQAALREAHEEAGLTLDRLEEMFRIYASPGASTDYFYCYLAACDLADETSYRGGLASEAEDLRLHVVSFDAAMKLLDSGEINAAPLVAMLLWLARNRDRLRAAA